MNEKPPDALRDIVDAEVGDICKRYQIDSQEAEEIVRSTFGNAPDLMRLIDESSSEKDLARSKPYKKARKEARKKIYYTLRQYKREGEQREKHKQSLRNLIQTGANAGHVERCVNDLLSTHVSTRERLPHYEDFYATLFELIDPPRTILDIGCGLHPLSYPFRTTGRTTELYIAADKDPDTVETLNILAPYVEPARLIPLQFDVTREKIDASRIPGAEEIEFAFMLKLIPVLHRHDRRMISRLADVPAKKILITASVESMTRGQNIKRREKQVLQQFITASGRPVLGELDIPSEFGYLLDAAST